MLVTHGVTFLPRCHLVVVMRDGCVSEAGSYDDLLERDGAFAEFIKTYLQETEELSDDDMSSDGETSATCEPSFMLCSHLLRLRLGG